MQRTRPCASLRGSPLTRHPLGGAKLPLRLIALAALRFADPLNAQDYHVPDFTNETGAVMSEPSNFLEQLVAVRANLEPL